MNNKINKTEQLILVRVITINVSFLFEVSLVNSSSSQFYLHSLTGSIPLGPSGRYLFWKEKTLLFRHLTPEVLH